MGFSDLTFTVGQKLSSGVLNKIDQNFDALAEGDTSSPRVPRPNVWGQFCGFSTQDQGIYASRGLSSLIRGSVGEYTIAFTTPFSGTDTNYVGANIAYSHNAAQSGDTYIRNSNIDTLTNSNCTFRTRRTSTSADATDDASTIFCTFWEYVP